MSHLGKLSLSFYLSLFFSLLREKQILLHKFPYLRRWPTLSLLSLSAASQAAAEARGRAGQQSAAASSLTGMTLQEAQQILNIATLTPEELQKVHTL